jgi:hypothetical protein
VVDVLEQIVRERGSYPWENAFVRALTAARAELLAVEQSPV